MLPRRQIFGLVLAGVFCAAVIGSAAVAIVNASREKTVPADAKPDFTLPSYDLWNEYQSNPATADQKYRGKTLKIIGVVSAVDHGLVGFGRIKPANLPIGPASTSPYRSMQAAIDRQDSYPPGILCYMAPDHRQDLDKVATGNRLTIVGVCIGTISRPEVWQEPVIQLRDCRVAPSPPATPVQFPPGKEPILIR